MTRKEYITWGVTVIAWLLAGAMQYGVWKARMDGMDTQLRDMQAEITQIHGILMSK